MPRVLKTSIIFDFDQDSVEQIDPSKHNGVFGTTKTEYSCILIGAKGLLDDKNRFEVRGTLAHVLCHFVMQIIYRNKCKPYAETDDEKQKKFDIVVKACRAISRITNEEDIIKRVYEHDKEIWHAELIVRVPHMLAAYMNKDKLRDIKYDFGDLFNFYELNVLPGIDSKSPVMKAIQEVNDLNEFFGVSKKLEKSVFSFQSSAYDEQELELDAMDEIQVLASNCVQMTMKALFDRLKLKGKQSTVVLMRCESLEIKKIFKAIVKSMKTCIEPSLLIDCDGKTSLEVERILKTLEKSKVKKRVKLVVGKTIKLSSVEMKEVEHSWNQLSESSKEKILKPTGTGGIEKKIHEIFGEKLKEAKASLEKKLHIERKFLRCDAKWNVEQQNFHPKPSMLDEVIAVTEKSSIFLLVDNPGNGKSTEFELITAKLKQKFPLHWVVYIDLKQFTQFYQRNEKVTEEFDGLHEIAVFLSERILKLQSVTSEVFVELFKSNRVIILMDAVDEISPNFNEFVTKLMAGIRNHSKNLLWVATRPHLCKDLEENLQTNSWKLTNLSVNDQREFFTNFYEAKEKRKEDIAKILESIQKFVRKLERNRSVLNPILMQMIAELFDDEEFDSSTANMFLIYDKFIAKMTSKLAIKGPVAVNDLTEFSRKVQKNVTEFHQRKALLNVFENKIRPDSSILKITSDLTVHQLNRVGLMFGEKADKMFFVHQSYSEFFVAEFVFEKLLIESYTGTELELVTRIWIEVMSSKNLKLVRLFLDDAIATRSSENVPECIQKGVNENPWILREPAFDGCLNLIKFVSLQVVQDQDIIFRMWTNCGYNRESVLMAASQEQSEKFVLDLLNLAESIFTSDSKMKELQLCEDEDGKTALNYAVENHRNEKPFKLLLDKLRTILTTDELVVRKVPLWSGHIFYSAVEEVYYRCKKSLAESEFKAFLKSTSRSGETILHEA